MQHPRRQFLHLAAAATWLSAFPMTALAQLYPSKPVRILVGFPAGGLTDITARLIGQRLSSRSGQQFVVENRPGAVTNIATEAVVNSPADGYTLLMATSMNAINATVFGKLRFNFMRDIVPVASVADAAFVLEVNPSIPAKTVPEFVAYATWPRPESEVPNMSPASCL
jgi:tripartite-type tricarboxylate transporter receptor subunit TctC